MQVEITGAQIDNRKKIIHLTGHSVDELRLIELERGREDRIKELHFQFNTAEDDKAQAYIVKWLHRQKATKEARTYGEAVRAVVGTVTSISGMYIAAKA